MPGDTSLARTTDYMEHHPDGLCGCLKPTEAVKWQDRVPTRSRAFGVCSCGIEPCFVKVVSWLPDMEARWSSLPRDAELHRVLHEDPILLSPFAHVRTAEDWIRIYPVWATDLDYFLHTQAGRTLPTRVAGAILQRVAKALSLMEDHGILHRDLKPSNILIRDFRTGGVPDFGSLDSIELTLADFSDSGTCGTEFWSSPENHRNHPTILSPIFSLGLVAWKLISNISFRRMISSFPLYNPRLGWPEEAEMYLWYPASPFAETVMRGDDRLWRDPDGLALRMEILRFIFASTIYDAGNRAKALQQLFGESCGDHPAVLTTTWLSKIMSTWNTNSHSIAFTTKSESRHTGTVVPSELPQNLMTGAI